MFGRILDLLALAQTVPGVADLEHSAAHSLVSWLLTQAQGTPLASITEAQVTAWVNEWLLSPAA